jgi:hypothetical protein
LPPISEQQRSSPRCSSTDGETRLLAIDACSAPAASTAPTTAYQSQDQQKHNGSNEGVYDQSNDTYPEVNTKSRQKPVTYERTDQTDEQITDQSETAALHDPACQPTRNNPDHDDYE